MKVTITTVHDMSVNDPRRKEILQTLDIIWPHTACLALEESIDKRVNGEFTILKDGLGVTKCGVKF